MKNSHNPLAKPTLCIGGPKDGERIAILHSKSFIVPTPKLYPVTDDSYMSNVSESFEQTVYHARIFNTGKELVYFWTPEGQTDAETFQKLTDVYEQHTSLLKRGRKGI